MNSLYRTMLFVAGNQAGQFAKAEVYQPDSIIFDLEDAVSIYEKDAARILVKKALTALSPCCPMGVRINGLDTKYGEEDVRALVCAKPAFLRLPKSETAENVKMLDRLITEEEEKHNIPVGTTAIISTIESALGVLNAYEIATASKRMIAIGLGAEDFRADMKTQRTAEGIEVAWARYMIATAAHAAKVIPLDFVYSDVNDMVGFKKDTIVGRTLGYAGRSVIHPSQVSIVHEVYTPTKEEVTKAQKIIEAYKEAMQKGSGVVALDGKMIDAPIITRAEYILERAGLKGCDANAK